MQICLLCKSKRATFFHKINKYSYYRCNNCLTLFLSPIPTQKQLDEYYHNRFEYTAGATNELQIRKRAKIILSQLKLLHPTGVSILDIGSGFGYFLDEARLSGLKPTGIEPSISLSSTPLKHFNGVNNMTFKEFYEKNKRIKKFDFITMIHVIEHVPNPELFIKQATDLLSQNGVLYIETPNLDSHLFYAERTNYTFLTPPDHLWIFSKKSFESIIRELKTLRLVKLSTYGQQEHIMGILKSKFQITNDKLQMNDQCQITNNYNTIKKRIKILIFDKFIASLLSPLLNINNKGSVLELYYRRD